MSYLKENQKKVERIQELEKEIQRLRYEILPEKVLDYLEKGKKVHAIKALRESTGLGLREAKSRIDEAEKRRITSV